MTYRITASIGQSNGNLFTGEHVVVAPTVFVGEPKDTHCVKCGEAFVGQERIERTGDGLPMHAKCAVSDSTK